MNVLLADALVVMLRVSTSMLKLLQRLPASKQGASTQEVCMQLELLMDGLAQREAAVKLRASQRPAASVTLPAHLDAEEPASEEEAKLRDEKREVNGQAVGDSEAGKDIGEVHQTEGDISAAHASASHQQQQAHEPSLAAPGAADAAAQQQQQAHEVLARMTAEYMPQLQALILQALGNRAKGLDIKNLLAPLQLNQLVLRRAEAHPVALTQAVAGLLYWKSNLAQLR